MANTKKQEKKMPRAKTQYSTNTNQEPTTNTARHMQAPRPVKDTQKPKALPRAKKK